MQGDYQPFVPDGSAAVSTSLFVLIAYSAIWIVLLLFLLSIYWRQRAVQVELQSLRKRLGDGNQV